MKKALIIGATGATGTELTKQLLKDDNFSEVHIFVRKAPPITHSKIKIHCVDFNNIESWKNQLTGDVLFSAMGTTLSDAGSKNAQFKIDVTYQFKIAEGASNNGVPTLLLVSSIGANQKSLFFYPKIKGQLEEMVKKLSFKTIYILRPPVLDRGSEIARATEKKSISFINKLNKFGLLNSQKPMSTQLLASKMIKLSKIKAKHEAITLEAKAIFNS